ncbi:arginine--tRNA ligase [Candidatus Nomurabacteria bacterium]|nr:arginine--tRNA ligase [Candidatus Nomurabacteria bacterium]
MKEKLEEQIKIALQNLGIETESIVLEHPADISNGDYSTNVALVYAKQLSTSPRDLAEKIKEEIEKDLPKEIEKIEIAGAGFINFYLSREFFADSVKDILNQKDNWGKNKLLAGKKVMVEYTQPNPFKPFHIGHLMSNAIGESISRVVEFSGAKTIRANYQGDVGPHVAKAIYIILKDKDMIDRSQSASVVAYWIGKAYSLGSDAYDNDPEVKKEIDTINQNIYSRSDEEVNKIYDWGKKVTLEAFEEIYELLGTKFDYYFFESAMAPIGQKIVRENVGKVFSESDGAIVFHAEEYDPKLHTRVFITSQGVPLYETKEIGLTVAKFEKENPDISIVTTAIEQGEYMKVVAKAISLIHPNYESRMKHVTHGMMRLSSGKMSSRKGNVVTGESLLQDSTDVIREKVAERDLSVEEKEEIAKIVGVSALKYSILRSSIGSNIIYDFDKSISFDGDSGPYLQYTAVRANSVIKKAESLQLLITDYQLLNQIPEEITVLEKLLYRFPEVVAHAYKELEPHHIATFLTELASAFNAFYANTIIIDKDSVYSPYRVALVEAFHQTMKNGLWLLGIKTPEKM